MAYEEKNGDVTLFKNSKVNEKYPDHAGYFIAHRDIRAGEKVGISLWNGKPDSKKTFGGKVQDYRAKDPKREALNKAVDAAVEYDRKSRERGIEDDEMDSCPF